MAPNQSTLRGTTRANNGNLDELKLQPPPIPFVNTKAGFKKSKKKKKSGEDSDTEDSYIQHEVLLNVSQPDSGTYKLKVPVLSYDNINPERYCSWMDRMETIWNGQEACPPIQKSSYIRSGLTGQLDEDWQSFHNKYLASVPHPKEENSLANKGLNKAIAELALKAFEKQGHDSLIIQRRYMRQHLQMPLGTDPGPWIERFIQLINWAPRFPSVSANQLGIAPKAWKYDEYVEYIYNALPYEYKAIMLQQDKKLSSFRDLTKFKQYLRNQYDSEELKAALSKANNGNALNNQPIPRKDKKRKANPNQGNTNQSTGNRKPCGTCGKTHLPPCRYSSKEEAERSAKRRRNNNWKPRKAQEQGFVSVSLKDYNKLVRQGSRAARKRSYSSSEGDSSDSDTEDYKSFLAFKRASRKAKSKSSLADTECMKECAPNASTPQGSMIEQIKLGRTTFNSVSKKFSEELHPSYSNRRSKRAKAQHYTAEVVVDIRTDNGNIVPVRALLDTGTSSTLVLRQFVPKGQLSKHKRPSKTMWGTLGGTFATKRKAMIDFRFPELDDKKIITWVAHVDDTHSRKDLAYDLIIGMDLMTELGIYVDTKDKVVVWNEHTTPLRRRGEITDHAAIMEAVYQMALEPPLLQQAEARQKSILDADYSQVDIDEHVDGLGKLTDDQKTQLKGILKGHPTLFGGGLGELKIKPIHLEVKEGSKPFHSHAYPVPVAYRDTTKKEVDRLTRIGVLERNSDSPWAAATFIQPKKTGDVRVLTDFRKINEVLTRRPYPLPKIADILYKMQGFSYATAIDLSMGYYHIPLDEASQQLCTTILPWGKYRYRKLPMGISSAPDIFQRIMDDLLGDLEFARTYIDDILITSDGSFEDHMNKLDQVLTRLEQAGFRANVKKCFFAEDELEYLGYLLTKEGVKPQPKKVEAILRLQSPKNVKQLRHFLGMVNYYRDMWRRRSHLLAPLSALLSKKREFKWTPECENAFQEMKRVMSEEAILAFPDFNKTFHVYTDASDYQLGGVIMQEGKPLAFYTRKLNDAQTRYSTGEQELLGIVETLKEFRHILLGHDIVVHTDHKNIIYGNLTNDRLVRWRLLLEEFGPTYVHVSGVDNVVADALSRMDIEEKPSDNLPVEEVQWFRPSKRQDQQALVTAQCLAMLTRDARSFRQQPHCRTVF